MCEAAPDGIVRELGTFPAVMLTAIASLLLACPPTTTDTSKDDHWLANPYGYRIHDEIAQPPASAPEPGGLPLWDLEAAQRQLDDAHDDDAHWLAWAVAEARGQRQTAHARVVAALSAPTLTAARLSWWLPLANEADARDALIDAHALAEDPHTSMLLELSLAIAHERLSCPVPLAADGACRLAGTEHLLRRDTIALELAQMWNRSALRHATHLRLDDADDLALQELMGRARLTASVDDCEAALVVRAPQGRGMWPTPSPDETAEQRRLARSTPTNSTRERDVTTRGVWPRLANARGIASSPAPTTICVSWRSTSLNSA
ncbi:hypothetical protein DB30_02330 [Enhygromyxa salina]|uniref:Uncharacterized protein n=1 Tax=Enhygromyxa salina TaxID=215803 RepID=A0A0C1ZM02_9BACT|nr:hypothetical protein [Enhygromyxa salina]KIG11883.1 hypothetical protein DB30_02330 [Enhygromyxa salina]